MKHGYTCGCEYDGKIPLSRCLMHRAVTDPTIDYWRMKCEALELHLKDALLENGLLLEVARLAHNERYSHTQPEADIWTKDLYAAIDQLPKDIADKIEAENRPYLAKKDALPKDEIRYCTKCGIKVENTAHVYGCKGTGGPPGPIQGPRGLRGV